MKAWLFQDSHEKKKHGSKTPWSVGWMDPDGKRRSKVLGPKKAAQRYARKIEGQLAAGVYESQTRKRWDEFLGEYKRRIANAMEPETKRLTLQTLKHFERILAPKWVTTLKTQAVDEYVAKRRTETSNKPGSTVSPATVNKELRHLKAVLRIANDWGYLPKVPKIRMVKEPRKLPRYVSPEHFAAIYEHCDAATRRRGRRPRTSQRPTGGGPWWCSST